MEESEKRRDRLKAMRAEASQTGACYDDLNSTPSHGLANPMIETSSNATAQLESRATPRFDYYTDPMAAFSGDRSRSKVSNHIPPEHFTPPTGPMYQSRPNYSPDQSFYQAQRPDHSSGHYRNPIGTASPLVQHQQTPPGMWNRPGGTSGYCSPSNISRGGNFSGNYSVQGGSPNLGRGGCPSPSPGTGRGPWFSYNVSPSPSPGLGCGGTPSPSPGRGRDPWLSNNMSLGPSPSPGLGRGGSPSPSPGRGRGRGSGRGLGYRDNVSAELRPWEYYNKSMIEDPWKFLEPVLWREKAVLKTVHTPDSQKSWLPESIRAKRAKVAEASNASSSQPSLAEYLAASLNEAANNESAEK